MAAAAANCKTHPGTIHEGPMARALLPLLLLSLGCLYGGLARAGEPAPLVPPDYWQNGDWQGVPDSTQVDKQRVLFARHDGDSYLGSRSCCPTGSEAASCGN